MHGPDGRNKFGVQKAQRDRSLLISAARGRGSVWIPRNDGQRSDSDVFSLPDQSGLEPYQMLRIDVRS